MKNRRFILILLLVISLLPTAIGSSATPQPSVYVVPVSGLVEKGLYRYLERAFAEAADAGASAIILELNTPGGTLDAAFGISDLILDSPVPVYAYVRHSALSAGAFLALSCRRLYMAPGSTIGAAEVRTLTGEEIDDVKTQSAWEAKMRAVAIQQGKDPQVAAAMVNRGIEIEGVVGEGSLLTLTDAEALDLGFADGVYNTRSDLLVELELLGVEVRTVATSPAETLARYITNPVVATLLITIGLAALVIEVMTPGFGVGGAISILAFSLFFGGHVFAGLAGKEVIFLFVLGIILLLVEAFIPNFGIVGLTGLTAVIASVVLSAATTGQGLRIVVAALFLALIIIVISLRFLKRTGLWSQIILQYAETKDLGYVGPGDSSHLVGLSGLTLTPLRPAGMAKIDGKRVDVVSEGGFVAQGTEVKVVGAEGSRIVVRQL